MMCPPVPMMTLFTSPQPGTAISEDEDSGSEESVYSDLGSELDTEPEEVAVVHVLPVLCGTTVPYLPLYHMVQPSHTYHCIMWYNRPIPTTVSCGTTVPYL